MSMGTKFVTAFTLCLVLAGLGVADAVLLEGGVPGWNAGATQSGSVLPEPVAMEGSSSAATSAAPAPTGVKKQTGPNVIAVAEGQKFTATDGTGDQSLLAQVLPAEQVQTNVRVLMRGNDRAGLVAWVESPDVKLYFLSLKDALHASFSPGITDLVDALEQRTDRPPRNVLSFRDPGISEEKLVFVRVRERLYEFHIAEGKQAEMNALIDKLSE